MNLLFSLLACLTFENKFSIDNDEDGFSVYDGDCNDNDSTITVVECTDNDGDGKSEYEGDCDDENPNINLGAAELDDLTECMLDADGDGFGDSTLREGVTPGTDCDDSNPDIKPTQSEICDGIDNNCDDAIDIDAEDSATWYYDADGDFYGSSLNPIDSCEKPEYYTEAKYDDDGVLIFDCDDGNRFAFPTAGEVCDGVDNDCDGLIDDADEDLLGNATRYKDADGDGFGDPNIFVLSCDPIAGFVQGDDPLTDAYIDCDDGNPAVYPSADEVCDGFDNDCDGLMDDADDGVLVDRTWYVDNDDDGYGTFTETLVQCEQPEGYASVGTDCDDESPFVFPGSEEVCDGIDNNCTGGVDEGLTVPWYADDDGDGFGASPQVTAALFACPETPPEGYVENFDDCNDSGILNANGIAIGLMAFPGADEYCDGIDNDCDTIVDENGAVDGMLLFRDVDNDSYGTSSITKVSCFLEEGYIDNDQDCNDQDASINPEGTETCQDGADEDCDGSNNDINALLCTVYYQDSDGDYFGNLEVSLCMCEEENDFTSLIATDCDDSNITVNPEATETCETEYDDNCDGSSNDMFAIGCSLFYKDDDLDGFGTDENQCLCVEEDVFRAEIDGDCNDTTALIHPNKPEICDEDDTDENCDGIADDASAIPLGDDPGAVFWYRDGDSDNFGDDDTFVKQCDAPIGYISMNGDCDDGLSSVNPSKEETCFSNDDEDCSGTNNDDGAIGCATFYADVDGDSYGTNTDSQCLCYVEDVYTSALSTDCDDESDTVNPGKDEVCDEADIDENCNGQADEMNAKECDVYFYDADDDGYGVATNARCLCAAAGEFRALVGGDCEDDDASYNPDFENCGLMGDIETSDAAMQFLSFRESSSSLKYYHSFGFDYNNDGYEDFVYVDPNYDTDYTDAGGVFLFLGPFESNISLSSTTIADEADLVFTIEAPQTNIGSVLGSVYGRNIDSDVFDEIVIPSEAGTFVIDDNLIGTGVLTNNSDGIKALSYIYLGMDLTAVSGDFNGDGVLDFMSGYPYRDKVGVSYGPEPTDPDLASMFRGRPFDQVLERTIDGFFGLEIEVQDVNLDGYDDVIITHSPGGGYYPVAWNKGHSVFLGSGEGLVGASINDRGAFIEKERYDVNGDGVPELLLTSSRYNTQKCAIYDVVSDEVIDGEDLNHSASLSHQTGICQWGDINGDGFVDVVQNDIYFERENSDTTGALFVWFGDENEISSLLIEDADFVDTSLENRNNYKYLSMVDFNEDGIFELYTGLYIWEWTGNEFFISSTSLGAELVNYQNFKTIYIDIDGDTVDERVYRSQNTYETELYYFPDYSHQLFCDLAVGVFSDFDNNGTQDLLCADKIYTDIVNSNNSSPLVSSSGVTTSIQIMDLDGDEYEDVIMNHVKPPLSANYFQTIPTDKSTIILNVLQEDQRILSGYLIGMEDLDGDGFDEIIMSEDSEFFIYNPITAETVSVPEEYTDRMGVLANFTGDSKLEILLYDRNKTSSSSNRMSIYEMGTSYDQWTKIVETTYYTSLLKEDEGFFLYDLNNDGYAEMYRYDGLLIFDLGEEVFGPELNVNGMRNGQYVDWNADMDGDGIYEQVIGVPSRSYFDPFEGNLGGAGRVSIELSTGFTWEMVGARRGQNLGRHVNIADVNGDGQADLLAQGSSSLTYLFYGPLQTYYDDNGNVRPARPDDADATLPGEVRNIFDNNNDGYDDLIMHQGSHAYLYHGAPNSAVEPPTSPSE